MNTDVGPVNLMKPDEPLVFIGGTTAVENRG